MMVQMLREEGGSAMGSYSRLLRKGSQVRDGDDEGESCWSTEMSCLQNLARAVTKEGGQPRASKGEAVLTST